MDLLAAFGVFLACVVGCMVKGASLGWALAAGFVCFFAVGARRGTPAPALMRMAAEGMVTSLKVLRILLMLGLLTALWRAGGTVAFFVWAASSSSPPGPLCWWRLVCPECSAWPLAAASAWWGRQGWSL